MTGAPATTGTIRRYIILEQTHAGAEVFTRAWHDWAGRPQSAGSVLHRLEAGIDVPLEELHWDADLQSDGEPDLA